MNAQQVLQLDAPPPQAPTLARTPRFPYGQKIRPVDGAMMYDCCTAKASGVEVFIDVRPMVLTPTLTAGKTFEGRRVLADGSLADAPEMFVQVLSLYLREQDVEAA